MHRYKRFLLTALLLSIPVAQVLSADALTTDVNTVKVGTNQVLEVNSSTASTSTTTGALKVAGGAGVQGDVHVGGDLIVTGKVESDVIGVFAQKTSAQTITANTTTVINFNSVVTDTHSAVTTGSGWKFTAPEDGWYRVSTAYHLNGSTSAYANIYKNGSDFVRIAQQTGNQMATGSIDVYLSANDYLQVKMRASATTPLHTVATLTWISIIKK